MKPATNQQKFKDVFEELCPSVHADKRFFLKICELESRFVTKKQEHIEFFGGNLTGAHVVRFTPSDRDKLFVDILECEEDDIKTALYAVRDEAGQVVIVPTRNVSSDTFNISFIWLIHIFHTDTSLSPEQIHEGKIRACMYLLYKYLTSLLFRYFRFPADPAVAKATYAELSYKFSLKQTGSWGNTLRQLAENAVNPEGIHKDTIATMDDDHAVLYMVTDIQGRVRDMLKNIYSVFLRVNKEGSKITSSSSFVESDGELILKDATKGQGSYLRYLKGIIPDRNSFIKQELVDVVAGVMVTASPRLLLQSLKWTSEHYQNSKVAEIDRALDLVMEHATSYLSQHRSLVKSDIAGMIDKLRGAYMSSRSTDIDLLECRKLVENIVKEATGSKNESGIAAIRTAWMLYVVTRAYTQRHYTTQ